jgi:cell division protein ZapA
LKPRTVTVNILDKEYQVTCPAEHEAELIVSASYLDKQMHSIRESGKVIGLERIAVMAALNISHELLQASEEGEVLPVQVATTDANVTGLARKIDEAMFSLRQMEIN